jgi:uncharacterized RDD family membrane protein YckC
VTRAVDRPLASTPSTLLVRRMLARALDALWQLPFGVWLWYALDASANLHIGWSLLSAALGVSCVQAVGEAILIWTFGTTPGKALAKLKVRSQEGAASLTFQAALLRSLKVVTWAMAFWMLPLTLLSSAWTIVQIRRGRPVAWERGGEATRVESESSGFKTVVAAWMVAASIPFLAGLWPALQLARSTVSQLESPLSRDVSRGIAGQWLWLHPGSGETLQLDSQWRLVSESFRLDRGQFHATFAHGKGFENVVKVNLNLRPLIAGRPCAVADLDFEEEQLTAIQEEETRIASRQACVVRGGAATAAGIRRGEATVIALDGAALHSVVHTYGGDGASRAEVVKLSQWFIAQVARLSIADGTLDKYYWRNELTGAVAVIPGSWALREMEVRKIGTVTYTFAKWRGRRGYLASKDSVAVIGLPKSGRIEVEEELARRFSEGIANGSQVTKRQYAAGDHGYEIVNKEGQRSRMLLRDGRRFSWFLVWANNESNDELLEPDSHQLLNALSATLN